MAAGGRPGAPTTRWRWRLTGVLITCSLACAAGKVGSATSDATGAGETNPDAPISPIDPGDFVAITPRQAIGKVKAVLTGGAVTADDVAAIGTDLNQLRARVRTWSQSDAGRNMLLGFFADAFQQSQLAAGDLAMVHDGLYVVEKALLANMQQSFARTVLALMDAGVPFNQVANTQRFMLTSALASYIAYTDASMGDDRAKIVLRYEQEDPAWGFHFGPSNNLTRAGAADPHNSNYLVFSDPNLLPQLARGMSGTADQNNLATCQAQLPWQVNASITYWQPHQQLATLRLYLTSGELYWWYPNNYAAGHVLCKRAADYNSYLTAADYNDWRMVTIRRPQGSEVPPIFFDMAALRSPNDLVTYTPYVGYFTTPSFLAQYNTNTSNQARSTANQTLITGLGFQIDGQDTLPLSNPTAVDAAHAAEPACLACHQTLDPLRQYFRQSYTLRFSQQQNTQVQLVPAQFGLRGVVAGGQGVEALGDILAQHPNFAVAWTVKLCSWANSATCAADDPEVLRLANLFEKSQFNFQTLLEETMVSPLVTYLAATQTTAAAGGQLVSIARRRQFCALLSARLNLTDVCSLQNLGTVPAGSVGSFASILPNDAYSRGVIAPLYVTGADPFTRSTLESMCALVAPMVVDNPNSGLFSSSDVPAAVNRLVTDLMALDVNASVTPSQLLQAHYDAAKAQSLTAKQALSSTFVTACTSALVASY